MFRRPWLIGVFVLSKALLAHDAHGRANAPLEARRLNNPVAITAARLASGKASYALSCAECHGEDGKSRTRLAGSLPVRPTDLSEYLMESMRDGEIYWVVTHGITRSDKQQMPAFESPLSDGQRWELVLWVRDLRRKQKAVEVAALGPYEWKLPPGFPYPKVPADNPDDAREGGAWPASVLRPSPLPQ